jgi:hypothetical protein
MKRLGLFIVAVVFAFSTMACCSYHKGEHKKCTSTKVTAPVKKDAPAKKDVTKPAKPVAAPAK